MGVSQEVIRKALRASPDGLTATEIAKLICKHRNNVAVTVRGMPDIYVDRWIKATRQKSNMFVPVYIAVDVPDNAPRPD